MTIHDILRFPRRVSEVLDDLHVVANTLHAMRMRNELSPPKSQREAALSSQVESQLEHIRKLETSPETSHEAERSLDSRTSELESDAKKHAYQVESWKAEEKLWGDSCGDLRVRIADLESQLLTTHDSLDCANSKITETESEVVAWTTRCAKDEERLAESNRKVAVLESQLKAHGIECEIRRAKR
jgi:chromosome segregation ATPase